MVRDRSAAVSSLEQALELFDAQSDDAREVRTMIDAMKSEQRDQSE
jgi:hypothetical protein